MWTNKKKIVSFNAIVTTDSSCRAGRSVTFTALGASKTALTDIAGKAAASFLATDVPPASYPVVLALPQSSDERCAADPDGANGTWVYTSQKK